MNEIIRIPYWIKWLSLFIFIFGIMTITAGGKALFTESGRLQAGQIVPFVLWYNFIAGFFYLLAGMAFLKWHLWAQKISILIAVTSFVILIALGLHVLNGHPYETRTLIAMPVRTIIWTIIALASLRLK